jgi:hypothetical protein
MPAIYIDSGFLYPSQKNTFLRFTSSLREFLRLMALMPSDRYLLFYVCRAPTRIYHPLKVMATHPLNVPCPLPFVSAVRVLCLFPSYRHVSLGRRVSRVLCCFCCHAKNSALSTFLQLFATSVGPASLYDHCCSLWNVFDCAALRRLLVRRLRRSPRS